MNSYPSYTEIITDAKFDDLVAIAQHCMNNLGVNDPVTKITITDIQNQDGARALVERVLGDIVMSQGKIVFARGVLSDKEQKHESAMFSKYVLNEDHSKWVDAHEWVDDYTHPYECYVFAPFYGLEDVVYAPNCTRVYMGLGYNSGKSKVTENDLKRMKNLTVMNNPSPVVYDQTDGRVEGGRFQQIDTVLWEEIANVSSTLIWARDQALEDSAKFAVKYGQRAFESMDITDHKLVGHVDKDTGKYVHNLFDEKSYQYANGINIDSVTNTYHYRSLDQIQRGTLDVECTDGQHYALWKTCTKMKEVSLVFNGKYFEIKDEVVEDTPRAMCPVGITLNDTRDAVLKSFQAYNKEYEEEMERGIQAQHKQLDEFYASFGSPPP